MVNQRDFVIAEIRSEINRARNMFPEGNHETRNDLIAYAVAYLGRAAEYVARNKKENHDPYVMLVKAAGLIIVAAEKELDND